MTQPIHAYLTPVPELDRWLDMNGRRVLLDLGRFCECGHPARLHEDRWSDADPAPCRHKGCYCDDFEDFNYSDNEV